MDARSLETKLFIAYFIAVIVVFYVGIIPVEVNGEVLYKSIYSVVGDARILTITFVLLFLVTHLAINYVESFTKKITEISIPRKREKKEEKEEKEIPAPPKAEEVIEEKEKEIKPAVGEAKMIKEEEKEKEKSEEVTREMREKEMLEREGEEVELSEEELTV